MNTKSCVVDGCNSPVLAKHMCSAHYGRMRKYGSVHLPTKPVKLCTVDGCDSVVRCSGLCSKHYKRWQSKGHTNLETRECEMCSAVLNPRGNARVCADCRPAFEKMYNTEWRVRNRIRAVAQAVRFNTRQQQQGGVIMWITWRFMEVEICSFGIGGGPQPAPGVISNVGGSYVLAESPEEYEEYEEEDAAARFGFQA